MTLDEAVVEAVAEYEADKFKLNPEREVKCYLNGRDYSVLIVFEIHRERVAA